MRPPQNNRPFRFLPQYGPVDRLYPQPQQFCSQHAGIQRQHAGSEVLTGQLFRAVENRKGHYGTEMEGLSR